MEEVPLIDGLSDEAFSASSSLSAASAPQQSTINSVSAWTPAVRGQQQTGKYANQFVPLADIAVVVTKKPSVWLQVQFDSVRQTHRVVTRGSPTVEAWVTSYKVYLLQK